MTASSPRARFSTLTFLFTSCFFLLLLLQLATPAQARTPNLSSRSKDKQDGIVRRVTTHALVLRRRLCGLGLGLGRRASAPPPPIEIVTEDGGSVSLAKLLELRKLQQEELGMWWNGSLPANSTWTVIPDDARLQPLLPEQLRSPSFAEFNSSDGAVFYWNISGYFNGNYRAVELVPEPKNETLPPSSSSLLRLLPRSRRTLEDNITEPIVPPSSHRGNFPWLDSAGGTLDLEISENHDVSRNLTAIQGSLLLKSKAQPRSFWSSLPWSSSSSSGGGDVVVLGGASVRFDLTGVHFLKNGGLLVNALPAESREVPDLRAVLGMLPAHFILPSNKNHSEEAPRPVLNETMYAINETLSQDIERLTDLVGDNDPTQDLSKPSDERVSHNCTDMHLYLRLGPATPAGASRVEEERVREYEHEMFFRSGASPMGLLGQRARPLRIEHAVFFSQRCNLVIHASGPENLEGGLVGLRYIAHRGKVMRAALCLALVAFLQLRLTMGMMRRARTASARIKIDWRTLLLQTIADMYTSILCAIPAVVWRNETNLLLIGVSFLVGCHFVGGEYQFLIFVVHDSQNDPLDNRPPPVAAPAPAPIAVPASASAPAAASVATTTPTPAGAGAGADAATTTEAVVDPLDQATAGRRQRSYRYIIILVFFFLLNFQPLIFFSILGPVLYSFWIPQIMRNVRRGSRRPFPRTYVVGMTFCRCLLPLYFWQCPNNIFFWEPTPLVWILIGYLWLQAIILLLQDELGPGFFLPARFQPEGPPSWDWHPPLSVLRKHLRQADDKGDLVTAAAAELEASAGEAPPNKHHGPQYEIEIGDCAICLSEIEPLRWDWRDEVDTQVPEAESEDDEGDGEGGDGDGDEYAYVSVGDGVLDGEAGQHGASSSSPRARGTTAPGTAGGGAASTSNTNSSRARQRRHLRTGSLINSWASSAVRVGRRVGRAISAAREHGGRGRSGAAAASAALGGGRTDIMVAPCHHIFHTDGSNTKANARAVE
ncbi:hypothetical protein CF336_g1219 [Tilletia laevis]|nr:hypothetical protein CF336_g1219 [Tilletia laevis]KAE8201337.1 hypothetical protein CF335_g3763 [Tilletia laevis]